MALSFLFCSNLLFFDQRFARLCTECSCSPKNIFSMGRGPCLRMSHCSRGETGLLGKANVGEPCGRRTSSRRRSWQSCWRRAAARRPRRRRRHWRKCRRSRPTMWATACSRPWAGARARALAPARPASPRPSQPPPPSSPSTRAAWALGYVLCALGYLQLYAASLSCCALEV